MNKNRYYLAFYVLTIAISLIVYLITLAPTVTFIDSGELAAVATTFGIAHPTGYPLFTILGHLFTKLPIGATEIYKLNLMSAVFCSVSAGLFFMLIHWLLSVEKMQDIEKPDKKKAKPKSIESRLLPANIITGISVFASLVFAFSNTIWSTANSVEVYSVHIFFIVVIVYFFQKAVATKAEKDEGLFRSCRYYLIFAFLTGLSFSNHMTTLLLAPACLVFFIIYNYKKGKAVFQILGLMAIMFIAGFSVYLYLPIRANMNPAFLWGNPYNLERLIWHITGKQFSVWIFSSQGSITAFLILLIILIAWSVYGILKKDNINKIYHLSAFIVLCFITYIMLSGGNDPVPKQFKHFLQSQWMEYGTGLMLLGLLGIYRLSRTNYIIYYFTLLTFFSCVFYSVNYDIHDIDSYFLLAYITVVIWIAYGAVFIYEKFSSNLKGRTQQLAFSAVLLLLSITTIAVNFKENDESKNYYVEEFTMNIFKNIEPNGIVISSQWDFWVSASWYYSIAKNYRRDIIIIDKELLRRSWYFIFLERNYPDLYYRSKTEIDKFLVELYKFEHNIPYDVNHIMKLFREMMTSFVVKNTDRKVYITWEIDQNEQERFAADYDRIPEGLLFRLTKTVTAKDKIIEDYKIYDFSFTPAAKTDYYHETIMLSYSNMLVNSAMYLISVNRPDLAKSYLELSLKAKPNNPQALELKRKYNL
jgi:hypothetical protein